METTQTVELKKTARSAGIYYLLVAIIAPIAIMYVPSRLVEWGDAAATANNILANEFLFRSGVAIRLIVQVLMLMVVWYLYRLFKQVDEYQAVLMILLYVIAIPVTFIASVLNIAALVVFKGNALASFNPEQMYELAHFFLKIGSWDTQMVQLYWGLWLLPFGILVIKSGFIPRILGVLLLLNGAAYITLALTFVLIPEYQSITSKIAMPFIFLGEIPIILWLLIVGVRVRRQNE